MLVLCRKINESIVIELEDGREIIVNCCNVIARRAYLGITCPRSINIRRAELKTDAGFSRRDGGESPALKSNWSQL